MLTVFYTKSSPLERWCVRGMTWVCLLESYYKLLKQKFQRSVQRNSVTDDERVGKYHMDRKYSRNRQLFWELY